MKSRTLRLLRVAVLSCGGLVGIAGGTAHAQPEPGPSWGAIASKNDWYGYAANHPTRAAAERAALNECARRAGREAPCTLRNAFDRACGALAQGNYTEWGVASAPTQDIADKTAAAECNAHLPTEPCKIVVRFCSLR